MVNFILSVLFSALALAIFGSCVSGVLGILSGAIIPAVISFVLLIIPILLYRFSLRFTTNIFSTVFVKFLVPVLAIFYLVNKVLGLLNIVLIALPF